MYEMVAFLFKVILGVPVTTDRQDRLGRLVHGHNVRDGNLSFSLVFSKFVVWQDQIDVHFE